MLRFLTVALLVLLFSCLRSTNARACSCSGSQGRLLVPQPGADHPAGAPILVAGSLPVDVFVYDATGAVLPTSLRAKGGALGTCASDFYLFAAETRLAHGELAVLLTDGVFADVPHTFQSRRDLALAENEVDVSVVVSHARIEPFEAASGQCFDVLAGANIVGAISVAVSLSEPAPIFVQASYDDPSIGPVREFVSTIPMRGDTIPADNASLELLVTSEAPSCMNVSLFDWTFHPLWGQRLCLEPGSSELLTTSVRSLSANLPRSARIAPAAPQTEQTGCTLTGFRPFSAHWLLVIPLLVSIRRAKRNADAFTARRRMASTRILRDEHSESWRGVNQ